MKCFIKNEISAQDGGYDSRREALRQARVLRKANAEGSFFPGERVGVRVLKTDTGHAIKVCHK